MTNLNLATDCWYLTGPTASGKTKISLELTKLLDAEILSLDSMAIYQGMDIGTAKPSVEERQTVPHHLIDLVTPDEEFSVARYRAEAIKTVEKIKANGRTPLFVGGTPLYLKTLLRGLCEVPEADWEFRKQVEEELKEVGQEALYKRLSDVDPLSASRLHPNDTRRLIRALEVYRATGQPLSHSQFEFDEGLPAEQCKVFVLNRDRSELHQRINQRVDAMFAGGFIEEVAKLTANDKTLSRSASQAVGYREVIRHLAGELSLEETIEQTKTRTRRFAKRQMTWFRSISECRFVDLDDSSSAAEIAQQVINLLN